MEPFVDAVEVLDSLVHVSYFLGVFFVEEAVYEGVHSGFAYSVLKSVFLCHGLLVGLYCWSALPFAVVS